MNALSESANYYLRNISYQHSWSTNRDNRMIAEFDQFRCCFNKIENDDWIMELTKLNSNKNINIFNLKNRLKTFASCYLIIRDLVHRRPVNKIYIDHGHSSTLERFEKIMYKYAPENWALTIEELNGKTYFVLTPG